MEILEATSPREGIELAAHAVPDLILVDINMPEMDGMEVASRLRQYPALRHVPIVALTANIMKNILDAALAAGCDGYIAKPIDVDIFVDQLLGFLSKNGK
jgi:two-component system cell cycle response regulator DivK